MFSAYLMGIVFCRLNRAVRALQPADAPRLLSQNRNQGRIEKTTAAAGQKLFFHLCPGSGAVPVIEIPKERRSKNKRGLNQREPPYGSAVFQKKTTADSCCGTESLLSSAKGIGGAGKNCKSTSSGQYPLMSLTAVKKSKRLSDILLQAESCLVR